MELKHVNPNDEIVVRNNLHLMNLYFLKKLVKIKFKNKTNVLFLFSLLVKHVSS